MMRWARHVARMGLMKNVYKLLVVKPEEKTLGYLGLNGGILKWISKKKCVWV
jgi:hypothetical protein